MMWNGTKQVAFKHTSLLQTQTVELKESAAATSTPHRTPTSTDREELLWDDISDTEKMIARIDHSEGEGSYAERGIALSATAEKAEEHLCTLKDLAATHASPS